VIFHEGITSKSSLQDVCIFVVILPRYYFDDRTNLFLKVVCWASSMVSKNSFYLQIVIVSGEDSMDDNKQNELDELKEKLRKKFLVEDDDLQGFGGVASGDGISGGG